MPAVRYAPLLAAMVIVVGGSGCAPTASSAAPPLVICGTTLWSGAEGAVVTDATGPRAMVTAQTAGDLVVLKLVDGCHQGATYSIDPATAATVAVRAPTSDGRTAAVALIPQAASFDVHITRASDHPSLVTVRLGANFMSSTTWKPSTISTPPSS